MKASELNQKIQDLITTNGDGEVVIINEETRDMYFVDDVYADTVNNEKQIVIEVR